MGSGVSQEKAPDSPKVKGIEVKLYLVGTIEKGDEEKKEPVPLNIISCDSYGEKALRMSYFSPNALQVFVFPLSSGNDFPKMSALISSWCQGKKEDQIDHVTLEQLRTISNEAMTGGYSVTPFLLNLGGQKVQGDSQLAERVREGKVKFPQLFPVCEWS